MFAAKRGAPFPETVMKPGLTDADCLIILAECAVWFIISIWEEPSFCQKDGTRE